MQPNGDITIFDNGGLPKVQVASAARDGFETAITTPGPEAYVAVQARDQSGAVLGSSPTIKG
jgi:hypothetical protein